MSVANIPPYMAAAMDRAKAERRAMNSPDPLTRYRARENAINRAMTELSSVLVQNAQKNSKIYQQIENNEAYSFNGVYYSGK